VPFAVLFACHPPCRVLSCGQLRDVCVFAGGQTGASAYSAVVDVWNSTSGAWSTATLSVARSDLAAAAAYPIIAFAGGVNATGISPIIDLFNCQTGAWSVAALSVARKALAGIGTVTGTAHVLFAGGETAVGFDMAIDILNVQTMAVRTAPHLCTPLRTSAHLCAALLCSAHHRVRFLTHPHTPTLRLSALLVVDDLPRRGCAFVSVRRVICRLFGVCRGRPFRPSALARNRQLH
jgi:hypothetical protein